MIQLQNITRYFGTKCAVSDITFHISKGEIVGFIGPNGAGKSTTMRILTGFLPPTSGHILICGTDMNLSPEQAKQAIGYLPENAPVWHGMTVYGFLKFLGELRGIYGHALRDRISIVTQECQIENVLNQGVETLSKGYRHRVCFAQALIHDPKILVLDEPTDGLDPEQKLEIRRLIAHLARQGKTVILSTHILDEVEAVCNRVIMVAQGHKVFDGTVPQFKESQHTDALIQAFLSYAQAPAKEVL